MSAPGSGIPYPATKDAKPMIDYTHRNLVVSHFSNFMAELPTILFKNKLYEKNISFDLRDISGSLHSIQD
jgi:hypothetical protein